MSNGPFSGKVEFHDSSGNPVVTVDPDVHLGTFSPVLDVGRSPDGGHVIVRDVYGRSGIHLKGDSADLLIGDKDNAGGIYVRDKTGKNVFKLSGFGASLSIGASDNGGEISVVDGAGKIILHLKSKNGDVAVRDNDGNDAIHLDGGNQSIVMRNGHIRLTGAGDKRRIFLDGPGANVWLGGNGEAGDLMLFHEDQVVATQDDWTKATVWLSGHNGDIVLKNADCAEEFDLSQSEEVEPGTVMVLSEDGTLHQSQEPYDKKVAGVVSGASDLRPAIVLDRKHSNQSKRVPVALVGKVYCKADAQYSPIAVGDLLTTSSTPGHAMKASDPLRAFGAVIGKALGTLNEGRALIPVLVALQ